MRSWVSFGWRGWCVLSWAYPMRRCAAASIGGGRHGATSDAAHRVPDMPLQTHEADAKRLLPWSLQRRANDAIDEERFQFLTLALGQVHQAIERRRQRVLAPSE